MRNCLAKPGNVLNLRLQRFVKMTTQKETFTHRDARAEDIGQLAALLSRTPDDGTAWQFPGVDDDGQFLFKGMLNWLKEPFTSTSKRIRVVEAEDGTLAALSIWLRRSRNADGEIVAEDWAESVPEAGSYFNPHFPNNFINAES